MHYLNFQSFPSPFTIPKLHLKYTKEILKNKNKNIGQRDFSFVYDNTGVKISIWTTGMKPAIPNHLHKYFNG